MASPVSLANRSHPEMTQYQTHARLFARFRCALICALDSTFLPVFGHTGRSAPLPGSTRSPPSCMYNNPAAMISLFPTGRTRPELGLIRDMPALSFPAGTLCLLLPIHTPSVTPKPSELHFYSGRHVRDRVRLHLRRVTDNNNDTLGTEETERRSQRAAEPSRAERARSAHGTSRTLTEALRRRTGTQRNSPKAVEDGRSVRIPEDDRV